MGLFKLSNEQREAGINMSDSMNVRQSKMKSHLWGKLAKGQMLTEKEQTYLQKHQTYSDTLRQKQINGVQLTSDEIRTLAALDGEDDNKVWSNSSVNNQGSPTNAPHCPSCHSTNIQFLGNDRKSFSVGKAAAGAILTGGVGVLAGFAGKKGKNAWICMNCSNHFSLK